MTELIRYRWQTRWRKGTCALALLLLALVTACSHEPPTAAASAPARTPTEQPTPSPMATLTPDPALRIETTLRVLHDGDYETSIILLSEALRTAGEAKAHELIPALARAYFSSERYGELVTWLDTLDLEALPTEERAMVLGLLARSHDSLGNWTHAISAYERYLELEDAAAYHVQRRIASAHRAQGQAEKALQQLQAIDAGDLTASTRADVLKKQADLLLELDDPESALVCLDEILQFAMYASYRASISQLTGEVLLQVGREDEGVAVLRQVLHEYPQTWGGYLALLALDEINEAEISDLLRGQILYHASHLEESIRTLERYRRLNPHGYWSTAHYYAGLAYHRLGQHDEAIDQFDTVIRRFPLSIIAADAWMAKARSLAAAGDDASRVHAEFARRYPEHERAPEALWRAAEWLQDRADWKGAARTYRALRIAYPDDSGAHEATFREALALYAGGDYETAREVWEDCAERGAASRAASDEAASESARVLVWLGLANARLGHSGAADTYWEEAAVLSPDHYYGLRARDLMHGVPLVLPTPATAEAPELRSSDVDWQAIAGWVSEWAQTPSDAQESEEAHVLVRRGRALWELGWHDEAMEAYRQHADAIRHEPQSVLSLAQHCHRHDVQPMLIWCARRLLLLSRSAEADAPPGGLLRLAYPTTYGHLVAAESGEWNVDPWLFLALILQESQFSPYAESWAGAVGLAQVMPDTGAWIAERMGAQSYDASLLLRPLVSVRYGVWYLSWALGLFDRSWPAALAAYNAGATSVAGWAVGESLSDPDLFYEMIPIPETKEYVRLVYEHYRTYQSIYAPDAGSRP